MPHVDHPLPFADPNAAARILRLQDARDEHHATVGLAPGGELVVGWTQNPAALRSVVHDTRYGAPVALPEPQATHPQIKLVGDRAVVATANHTTGELALWLDPFGTGTFDQRVLVEAEPDPLTWPGPRYPDVAAVDDRRAVIAWRGRDASGERTLTVAGLDVPTGTLTPAIDVLQDVVGPVSVGSEDGLVALAAVVGPANRRHVEVLIGRWPGSSPARADVSGQLLPTCVPERPSIAVTSERAVVTWQCEAPDRAAYVAVVDEAGQVVVPATLLSTNGCGLSTSVSAADDLALLAWQACDATGPDTLQVGELWVSTDLAPSTVHTLTDPAGRSMARPDVHVARQPGGWGVALSWEADDPRGTRDVYVFRTLLPP